MKDKIESTVAGAADLEPQRSPPLTAQRAAYMLFGTAEPQPTSRRLAAGPLSLDFVDGAIRTLCWHGVEVLRAIDCPIRDENWSTSPAKTSSEISTDAETFKVLCRRVIADGALSCRLLFDGRAEGTFRASMELTAHRNFRTNRAGFTVLHPLDGVVGAALTVLRKDGSKQAREFPALISPAQVAFEIAGLRYVVEGVQTSIAFQGDIFEMEDQRNWSDASFKTYCRPLSLPIPYELAAGETLKQEIEVHVDGDPHRTSARSLSASLAEVRLRPTAEHVPTVALAMDALSLPDSTQRSSIGLTAIKILQLRVTPETAATVFAGARELISGSEARIALEIVIPEDQQAEACLSRVAAQCKELSLPVSHAMALPQAYLKSYQPTGRWPTGPTPRDACVAARKAFTNARIGSGSLTNFTELNRCRLDVSVCDYVTHGSTAIVHAADDRSVIESLEGLSYICASTRALAGAKEYHLGLVSIGMRSNPYGADFTPNPEQLRLTMAKIDPRQRGLFAAVWAVGAVAATAGHAVSSMALASPVGPFGILYQAANWPQPIYDELAGAAVYPLFHVVRALSKLAGMQRLALHIDAQGIVGVAAEDKHGTQLLLANLTYETRTLKLPQPGNIRRLDEHSFEAAITNPDWLRTTEFECRNDISLNSLNIAFVEMPSAAS